MTARSATDITARSAIEALRAGVPNWAAIRLLETDESALRQSFLDQLRLCASAVRDEEQPEGIVIAGAFGAGKSHQLGTGLGLVIGAKIGAPEKMCVNFMGDAAFGMTGLDFETAARCGIPITTIVLNNSTMAIETHAMAFSHEKYKTRDLGGNYANLAQDLGGWSERVTDPGEVAGAILRARRVNESGRAALLEFITSAETAFSHRRGAA